MHPKDVIEKAQRTVLGQQQKEPFTEKSLEGHGGDGYVLATCKNHPEKRWFMKDPRTAAHRISQNVGLHYLGDLSDGLHANIIQDARLRDDSEYVAAMKEVGYGFECSCPFSDIVPIY